jgi:hypothetical protein
MSAYVRMCFIPCTDTPTLFPYDKESNDKHYGSYFHARDPAKQRVVAYKTDTLPGGERVACCTR